MDPETIKKEVESSEVGSVFLKLIQRNFTLEQIQELQQLQGSPKDCLRVLGEVLDLEGYQTRAKNAFVLDYFHGINSFVMDRKMKTDQSILVFNLGKDLLCNLLGGKTFQESEDSFKTRILALSSKHSDADISAVFSPIDLKDIIDFFVSIFFQHYALYKCCFFEGSYIKTRDEVVVIETAIWQPLSEALSQEEVDAQELKAREAKETEEKARQEAAQKAEAERIAAEEASRIEESKKRPQTLDEAVECIVREKLDKFKESFLEGCKLEQKRLFEKLGQLEVSAAMSSDGKTKKQ